MNTNATQPRVASFVSNAYTVSLYEICGGTVPVVRIASKTAVFIGHLIFDHGRIIAIRKIEMYLVKKGVESFAGYAEGDQFTALWPSMVLAARSGALVRRSDAAARRC